MNERYWNYLQGPEWQAKRIQRLRLSGFRCEVCAVKNVTHVHHLTYDRIYHEAMDDLLPLCSEHHEIVERLIHDGALKRTGDVKELATRTIRLLKNCDTSKMVVEIESSHDVLHEPQRTPKWSKATEKDRHRSARERNTAPRVTMDAWRYNFPTMIIPKRYRKRGPTFALPKIKIHY